MKKNIILFLLFTGLINSVLAQETVQQANAAYAKGEFTKAIDLYQKVVEENGVSAEIYYNIGNSYFRINKIAPAILHYERALLLSPGDKEIRANLTIAHSKTVDKIEPVSEFFLTDWYNSFQNMFSTNRWSEIAISCFILFIICLTLFFFTRKIILKKTGFYCGLVLLIFTLSANIFAYNQKKKLVDRQTAIIFSPTVNIKSSPDNSGTDLFILHEGTKVDVKSELNEWSQIETADGNVGWIKTEEIEII
ncbi:MAG: tetratricopeptide repeat protein [Dysgonamonadaceae bacterium]|jgi:tetratricopeptide (TPR) repeat protein|nr:tetratricopeptide repeat protein [Dysgonamonadaceae bacterium]